MQYLCLLAGLLVWLVSDYTFTPLCVWRAGDGYPGADHEFAGHARASGSHRDRDESHRGFRNC